MKIKTYKYEKIEVAETELNMPTEPFYCFETGIRRAIRIVPAWTTWNVEQGRGEEYIFEYYVTCIYRNFECKIEKFTIQTSQIESIYNDKNPSNKKSIIELIMNDWGNKRTKEDFELDLKEAFNEINS